MKNFILEIITLLALLIGGGLFVKAKFLPKKTLPFIPPPPPKPLPEAPDRERIIKEIKNETPQESVDHVNALFDELFPSD